MYMLHLTLHWTCRRYLGSLVAWYTQNEVSPARKQHQQPHTTTGQHCSLSLKPFKLYGTSFRFTCMFMYFYLVLYLTSSTPPGSTW